MATAKKPAKLNVSHPGSTSSKWRRNDSSRSSIQVINWNLGRVRLPVRPGVRFAAEEAGRLDDVASLSVAKAPAVPLVEDAVVEDAVVGNGAEAVGEFVLREFVPCEAAGGAFSSGRLPASG